MEWINSLTEAIKSFRRGMGLVSHDFRLLSKVAEKIWVCDNKSIGKVVRFMWYKVIQAESETEESGIED